jgi:hypothetical protein
VFPRPLLFELGRPSSLLAPSQLTHLETPARTFY